MFKKSESYTNIPVCFDVSSCVHLNKHKTNKVVIPPLKQRIFNEHMVQGGNFNAASKFNY